MHRSAFQVRELRSISPPPTQSLITRDEEQSHVEDRLVPSFACQVGEAASAALFKIILARFGPAQHSAAKAGWQADRLL
jgi:hypothetical protein